MGTAKEWIWVVCAATFFGGSMLYWESLSRSDEHIKPAMSFVDVLGCAILGLFFGIGSTFRWRVFHWPLIVPMIATLAATVILGRLVKRKRRSSE